MTEPIISVRDLTVRYRTRENVIYATENVSFDLHPGQILTIVGESGSGKTTVGRCLLRILEPSSGSVRYQGADGRVRDLAQLRDHELKDARREIRIE